MKFYIIFILLALQTVKTSLAAFSPERAGVLAYFHQGQPDSGRRFFRKGDYIFQAEKSSRKAERKIGKSHGFLKG
jgi:hypothetical protein